MPISRTSGSSARSARRAGLIRYNSKNEVLDWPQVIKEALANGKPNAIVVMLGLNDRVPLRDKAPPPSANAPAMRVRPARVKPARARARE